MDTVQRGQRDVLRGALEQKSSWCGWRIFTDNWGSDVVYDFDDGVDILDLTGVAGIGGFGDLTVGAVGGDAVVSFGSNQIKVVNAAGLIGANDFVM
jgi:hypothetical protein